MDPAPSAGDDSPMTIHSTPIYSQEEERARTPQAVPKTVLTPEGMQALQEELDRLRARYEVEFVERLREARALGGNQENDEYLQIKEEEAVCAARIRRLELLIGSARVLEPARGTRVAAVGSMVELRDPATGETRWHRLKGGFEPLGSDGISVNSPVGQALLGRKVGEPVTVRLPQDREVSVEIAAIRRAPRVKTKT